MHILQISATACCFISLLLLLISLGSDYWWDVNSAHLGLWKQCTLSSCRTISKPSDKLKGVQALMILGMISGAVSLFCLCATYFRSHLFSFSMAKFATVSSLCAGLLVMIAMSLATSEIQSNYGWSFGLGWASFPLFLITSGLAFVFQTSTAQ